jgi:hypothetical protein
MFLSTQRFTTAVVFAAALAFSALPALAQNGDGKGGDQRPGPSEGVKETQKKVDEIAEASSVLKDAAGQPECTWLGQRVINRLWSEDLDAAFRHLEMYDRFGCPGGHIQMSFRCLVQQGTIDPKVAESLNGRVHACWINPASPAPPASTAAAATGTTSR